MLKGGFGQDGIAVFASLAVTHPDRLSISVSFRRAVSLTLNPDEYVIINIALCLRFLVTEKRDSASVRSKTTGSFLLLRGC